MTELKEKEGGIHYILYISRRRGSWGWLDLWVLQVLWVWWVLQGVVGIAGIIHRRKKKFFLFLPSHPHKCGSSALFIGVSSVRAGVRVELLPSHLPSHYPHTSGTGKYFVKVNLQNLTKVPEKYSCLVPTVQHRYTNSIAMPDYQYSYAGLSV